MAQPTMHAALERIRSRRLRLDAASWRPCLRLFVPGHLHADRYFILDRHCQECWRVDLEVGERSGNRAGELRGVALPGQLERDLFVVCGLAN